MKRYRLLNNLPGCPEGTEFIPIRDGESYMSVDKKYSWPAYDVENNPMWFELIKQEE